MAPGLGLGELLPPGRTGGSVPRLRRPNWLMLAVALDEVSVDRSRESRVVELDADDGSAHFC